MDFKFATHPRDAKQLDTQQLREDFLIGDLMQDDKIRLTYTHYDRLIVGGAKPVNQTLSLETHKELKANFFLERRELGIINVGGNGTVTVDGQSFFLDKLACVYAGKGAKEVNFKSEDPKNPAIFYLLSAPAHANYPTTKFSKEDAAPVKLGDITTSNKRTIYKYIHEAGIQSCQLVLGLTILEPGCVWNSVPSHTHTRRSEVYFYFDLAEGQRLFHMMGEPKETRHIIMKNYDAVVSPPWSEHFGCGTSNYGFIWGMAGENKRYDDMDATPLDTLL
jgi:4-deoxy-L-threo-5-hexosulose-uronate ketol-isomerase